MLDFKIFSNISFIDFTSKKAVFFYLFVISSTLYGQVELEGVVEHPFAGAKVSLQLKNEQKKIVFCAENYAYKQLKLFYKMQAKVLGKWKSKDKIGCFLAETFLITKTDLNLPFYLGILKVEKNSTYILLENKKVKTVSRPTKGLLKLKGKKVLVEFALYPFDSNSKREFVSRYFELKV